MTIGLGEARKTVLLIDGDSHARAILRNALEAEGFSVGEAADNIAGERTAKRVAFDAILIDPMTAALGTDHGVAGVLHHFGSRIPIYLVSGASNVLAGMVGLRELGIAGVFLKPADPAIVVQTLKTRLDMPEER